MESKTGTPVEGEDFFGREKELQYAWRRIKSGNNLILPSPRRVGKTSFALKILEIAKLEDWETISINLENNTSEVEFIETFVEKLKKLSAWSKIKVKGEKLLDTLKQFKPSYEQDGVKVSIEWQKNNINIYQQLNDLIDHEKPTLIFLDEFTVLLSRMIHQENGFESVTPFLHRMRDLRIKSGSKIRWIFCSSVGIENFTHTHKLSATMNDISDYFLKSFDNATSQQMLQKLGEGNNLRLTTDIQGKIIEKLSFCLPYFLQLMFEKINYLHEVENHPLTQEIVETAYNLLISEKHFNTWIERIDEQYGENNSHAFTILKHICQEQAGSKRQNLEHLIVHPDISNTEEIVSKLLYMLKNDGYLMEENDLYLFRSPLLRDFWFNRFVK